MSKNTSAGQCLSGWYGDGPSALCTLAPDFDCSDRCTDEEMTNGRLLRLVAETATCFCEVCTRTCWRLRCGGAWSGNPTCCGRVFGARGEEDWACLPYWTRPDNWLFAALALALARARVRLVMVSLLARPTTHQCLLLPLPVLEVRRPFLFYL